MHWLLMPFRRAFDYSGRSGKKEFFTFFWIFLLAIPVSLTMLIPVLSGWDPESRGMNVGMTVAGVYFLTILVPAVALFVRRFHDFDWSGWWLLGIFVPVAGVLAEIAAMVWVEGTIGKNRFGPDPKTTTWRPTKSPKRVAS